MAHALSVEQSQAAGRWNIVYKGWLSTVFPGISVGL